MWSGLLLYVYRQSVCECMCWNVNEVHAVMVIMECTLEAVFRARAQ